MYNMIDAMIIINRKHIKDLISTFSFEGIEKQKTEIEGLSNSVENREVPLMMLIPDCLSSIDTINGESIEIIKSECKRMWYKLFNYYLVKSWMM